MDAPQKLAFIVQSNRLQGLIWQALLKSQKLAVISELAKGDLADCINQIAGAGLTLPDAIVLDAEAAELNPYEFCRWCRNAFPEIQIFLTRCRQFHVSDTERRWARQQGATDFLSGFNREILMTSATENVKAILTSLDYPFLNEKALLTVLLNIRRQLSTTQLTISSPTARPAIAKGKDVTSRLSLTSANPSVEQSANSLNQTSPDPLNDVDWFASGRKALSDGKARKAAKETFAPPPAVKTSALPKPARKEKLVDGTAVRRYRGVTY